MKNLLIVTLLCSFGVANATVSNPPISANASAGASAGAAAIQGQSISSTNTSAALAASGGSTSTSGDNSVVVNANTTHKNNDYTVKNVPNVMLGDVAPTAPCMGSSTMGGAGAGFGIAIGTSWESEECMIGELTRSFEQAGYKEDAMAVRCTSRYAAVAPSCKALLEKNK